MLSGDLQMVEEDTPFRPARRAACSPQTLTKSIAALIACIDSTWLGRMIDSVAKRTFSAAATPRIWPLDLLRIPVSNSSSPHISWSCSWISSYRNSNSGQGCGSVHFLRSGLSPPPNFQRLVRRVTDNKIVANWFNLYSLWSCKCDSHLAKFVCTIKSPPPPPPCELTKINSQVRRGVRVPPSLVFWLSDVL